MTLHRRGWPQSLVTQINGGARWLSRFSNCITMPCAPAARWNKPTGPWRFIATSWDWVQIRGRPQITGIPGYWVDVGGRAQVHLMGVEGDSRFAKGPGQDPAMPHVAFAVEDIVAARSELDRMGTTYWVAEGIVGPESQQVFMHDPAGNMIELHQADTCRCQAVTRLDN